MWAGRLVVNNRERLGPPVKVIPEERECRGQCIANKHHAEQGQCYVDEPHLKDDSGVRKHERRERDKVENAPGKGLEPPVVRRADDAGARIEAYLPVVRQGAVRVGFQRESDPDDAGEDKSDRDKGHVHKAREDDHPKGPREGDHAGHEHAHYGHGCRCDEAETDND